MELDLLISFDADYRSNLWKNRVEGFIDISRGCIKFTHFIKVIDEEAKLLTGKEDLEAAVRELLNLGAIVCTKLGAIAVLPNLEEVMNFY